MKEWYCYVAGQQHGPVSAEQLQEWIRAGSVQPSDYVWSEGMADWTAAQSAAEVWNGAGAPPIPPIAAAGLKPHRGGAILALGILGLAVCFICGIIAWVMANTDLREIDAGLMDPAGRGITQAGKICAIISVCLAIAVLAFCLIAVLIMGVTFFSVTEMF